MQRNSTPARIRLLFRVAISVAVSAVLFLTRAHGQRRVERAGFLPARLV